MMRSNLLAPIRPRRIKIGLIVYLAVTYSFSWGAAFAVKIILGDLKAPILFSLFVSSLAYLISAGWQPLLAVWLVRRFVDPEYDSEGRFRSVNETVWTASLVLPFALTLSAMVLTVLAPALFGATGNRSDRLASEVTLHSAISASMLVWTAMLIVWMQTVVEEVGWRGYFLVKLMQLTGPRAGLGLHGVVWGLWYAPLVLVGGGASSDTALAGLGFVVTCCLLGALLGWLRLASRSLVPNTIANSVLTMMAGFPLVLYGVDPGPRSAIYRPAGWLPLALCVLLLFATRLKHAVVLPGTRRATKTPSWIL